MLLWRASSHANKVSTMSFDYIRVDDILTIHADQIERYGGGEGIRDSGLVEAALWWKSFPE